MSVEAWILKHDGRAPFQTGAIVLCTDDEENDLDNLWTIWKAVDYEYNGTYKTVEQYRKLGFYPVRVRISEVKEEE